MRKCAPGVLLFVLSLCGLAVAQKTPDRQSELLCVPTVEDYSVYTAILSDLGGPEDPEEAWQGKELLVKDQTSTAEVEEGQMKMWGFRSNSKAAPEEETVADLKARSGRVCEIPALVNYKLIKHEELDHYFRKGHDGWKDFYKQHPQAGGYWQFSLPGYSSARDEALVYVSHGCGWLCGTGHLYLLKKHDGKWQVINRVMLWIS